MSFEYSWHTEGYVVYERLIGTLSLSDFSLMLDEYRRYADQLAPGATQLHVIIDVTEMNPLPRDFNIQNISKALENLNDPRLGWNLVVGAGVAVSFMTKLVKHVTGMRFNTFDTIDDAMRFVRKIDPAVPLPDAAP